jgi:uncharacterized protein YggT (Ycf19 family)
MTGMQAFGFWDTLFNMLMLLVWFRLWVDAGERQVVFNPHLAPLGRMADGIVGFVRSAFASVPPRVVAGLGVVLLVLLRALIVPGKADWRLSMGFERIARLDGVAPAVLFSVLSFAAFLFRIWGVSLLYCRSHGAPSDRTSGALHCLSLPFTAIKPELRPFVLLLMGGVIVSLADVVGTAPTVPSAESMHVAIDWESPIPVVPLVQTIILSLAGWAQVLLLLQYVMIMLIIGSWVSLFTSSASLMMFCRDWTDMLLGPLRTHRVHIGAFDLSPLVFFIGLMIVHGLLMAVLTACYLAVS